MKNAEILNSQFKKEFQEKNTYLTLERYVMSELLSPIEDYVSAIQIIKENEDLIEGLNLYYIATDLSTMWFCGAEEFLEKLNSIIDTVPDKDKAIIYYLNANYISYNRVEKNLKDNKEYKEFLTKSIECSGDINFANNWLDFARILDGKESQACMEKARANIKKNKQMKANYNETLDYILSSQSYIDEFILGIT